VKPQGDPGLIRSAAVTFGQASDALERTKVGLNQSVQALHMEDGGGWISPASGAFKLAWAQDVPAYDQSARAMLDTATALRDYASALEHALSEWKAAVSMTAGTGYTLNDDGSLTAPPTPHPTPADPKPTIDPAATNQAQRAQARANAASTDLQTAARTAGARFTEIAGRSRIVFPHPGGVNHPEGEGEHPWAPSPVDLALAALAISSDSTHGASEALPETAAALRALAADHRDLSRVMGKAATAHDWALHSEAKDLWNGVREAEKDLKDSQKLLTAVDESGIAGVLNTSVEIGGKAVRVVPLAAFALSVGSDVFIDHNSAPEAVTREGLALGGGLAAGMGASWAVGALAGVAVPGVGEVIIVAVVGGLVAYGISKGVAVLWKKWGGGIDHAWDEAKNAIADAGGGVWHWVTHPGDWF
jgi:hypothetical protein